MPRSVLQMLEGGIESRKLKFEGAFEEARPPHARAGEKRR
jgi:hypothetical protein